MQTRFSKLRILGCLLAVCFFVIMLPVSARAAIDPNHAYAVGENSYTTLEAAIAAVPSGGGTIIMQKDASPYVSETIKIEKNIVFDLSGGNLHIRKSGGLALEVKDCSVGLIGDGYLDITGGTGVHAINATITLRNVKGTQGNGAYAVDGGRVDVLGSAEGIAAAVFAFGARDDTHVSTITVAGNAVSTGGSAVPSIGAKAEQLGVVTVNGNATGIDYGVYAYNYATITVGKNVTATGSGGSGSVAAYASDNSKVTIDGSLTAEIFAEINGTRKDVSEKTLPTTKLGYHTYAESTSTIWVKEPGPAVTQLATPTNLAWDETVPGKITAKWNAVPNATKYYVYLYKTDVSDTWFLKTLETNNQRDFAVNLEQYGTGSYAFKVEALPAADDASHTTSELSVASPILSYTAPICKIGTVGYVTLDAAIAAVEIGGSDFTTITLLQSITHTSPVVIDRKKITFALDTYNLVIDTGATSESTALEVKNGGGVKYTGDTGKFHLIGHGAGLSVNKASAEVSSVKATGNSALGVLANGVGGSTVAVKEGVHCTAAGSTGAAAYDGSRIEIDGQVLCDGGSSKGVRASGSNSLVKVGGGVTAAGANGYGMIADNGGEAQITGDVLAGATGINVYGSPLSGKVTVTGNVTVSGAGEGDIEGVAAGGGGTVTIGGDLKASGTNCNGVYASNSNIMIAGKVESEASGVHALLNGKITIDGELIAKGAGADDYYIKLGPSGSAVKKIAGDGVADPDKPGYLRYSDGNNDVWVKNNPTPVQPTVTTSEATNVSTAGATLNGNVTADGGAAVTERGFVYAAAAAPAIGGGGVTKVTAGAGTGIFTANISGLEADKTYHARAYAINGKGTAYGADISFKTAKAPTEIIAEAKEGGITKETLPVAVDSAAKTGTVRLAADKAAQFLNNEKPITIAMPNIGGVNAYRLELPADVLRVGNKGKTLTISTAFGSLRISGAMLAQLDSTVGKTAAITLSQGEKTGLSDAEKTAIGNRPLVRLVLTLDGAAADWENFGAPVTVTIPYAASEAEKNDPGSIIIWYLDGTGAPVSIPNGRYHAGTSTVTFVATHFSAYGVGYHPVAFHDVVKGNWHHQAVSFIAARGVALGTGGGKYSPAVSLTRAQALVMLMRAYGIEPDANPKDNFSDAGNAYYTKYLAAAKRLGIAAGVGDNLFAPEQKASREEFFVFLYNLLKAIDRLPDSAVGKDVSDFSDAAKIAVWAQEAVNFLVKAGIVNGSGGKLSPDINMTRAEMAQVLYNLLSK